MEVKIMFLSNVEVKGFIRNYLILFIITIGLSIEISFVSINIIKNEVVENNQAIIGSIVAANPSFKCFIYSSYFSCNYISGYGLF